MAFSPPSRDATPARSSSVRARRGPATSALDCCCGRVDCVFLRRNCSILETVEKDVHTAARLGQALLARHEAYLADAERDRLELTTRIQRLEMDKLDLEAANAAKLEENRDLLDQLEVLNHSISDSDTKIRSLEASLLSSQQTVRRLESAAARASHVERHISVLEEEQDKLHHELRSTREDARTHAQRFKEAQRGILDMQDQLERIEEESRQERQRHAEVMGRVERQREMDRHLDVAAGRLKGAAATRSLHDDKNGSNIVGHFVRDLLQDNANLQLAIAELREMLLNSNDEMQSLRDQLVFHQPVPHDDAGPAPPTLDMELEPMGDGRPASQALHIHHHYHAAPRPDNAKRPRKKRHGLLPGVFTPPASSAPSSPRPSGQWGVTPPPTAPALLSPVSGDATLTPSRPPRHAGSSNPPSVLSSSAPNSPQANQLGAVFDSGFSDSAMTSPTTSFDSMSPTWRAAHRVKPSLASSRSFQSLSASLLDSAPNTPCLSQPSHHAHPQHTIHEEDEGQQDHARPGSTTPQLMVVVVEDTRPAEDPTMTMTMTMTRTTRASDVGYSQDDMAPRPWLRRTPSHESIMSLTGGLDIHTLKSRPSQMTLRRLGGADAVVTGVTARPTISRASSRRSDVALRDHFASFQSPRSASSPVGHHLDSPGRTTPSPQAGSHGLSRWVGWRPWGGGSASNSARSSDKERDKDANRAPGINQPGAIPGFQEYWAAQKRKGAPAQVTAETVDRDALTEGLQE